MSSPLDATLQYAWQHRDADVATLLLHPVAGIDMGLAAQQIEGWQTARTKWPQLANDPQWLFPPRLNREQSSSEQTAQYKAEVAGRGHTMADLTGGMGIDTLFLGQGYEEVHYVEHSEELCRMAAHNFGLRSPKVAVHCADSMAWVAEVGERLDLIYIDPARRDAANQRVSAFEDCTPDILVHLPLLRSRCRRLMVKASPMIDLHLAWRQLAAADEEAECHVVAVKGECKEVLFVVGEGDGWLHCANILASGTAVHRFDPTAEAALPLVVAEAARHYLYEPNAALMKGGCFRQLGQQFGLPMLGASTHLYTSDVLLEDFPGRVFEVEAEVSPTRKGLKGYMRDGRCNIVCRNYPASPDELRRSTGLRDGGDLFLIATTVGTRRTAFMAKCVARG